MAYFAVNYRYDAATTHFQDRMRPDHRAYLASLAEAGSLLASGPLQTDPARPSALLILRADDEAGVRELLSGDPFQKAGYVEYTEITAWNPVVGVFAEAS